jgi:hypothetical protein
MGCVKGTFNGGPAGKCMVVGCDRVPLYRTSAKKQSGLRGYCAKHRDFAVRAQTARALHEEQRLRIKD